MLKFKLSSDLSGNNLQNIQLTTGTNDLVRKHKGTLADIKLNNNMWPCNCDLKPLLKYSFLSLTIKKRTFPLVFSKNWTFELGPFALKELEKI